ncbi:MAG: COX15/CtaA family protein [Alphaproteobacteria bacterium]|nr:COX15/CtaA family protein [Alphaproteobacteria bacterium]
MTALTTSLAQSARPGRRAVGLWLAVVAAMIAAMVLVGGLTRLTGSGLSITTWHPISGVVPPLSHAAWMREFDHYKEIPQYRFENRGMTLSQFKGIFWWEWSHRLLGRLIGLVFLLPFLWFAWRGYIVRREWPRMITLFVLGGLQGLVGWWMVTSGIETSTRVSVSQYRLAAHLGLALFLFAVILWTAFQYLRPKLADLRPAPQAFLAKLVALLVYVQMLMGALVAGLHAGLIYETWPSMNGGFGPERPFVQSPWYLNFFANPGLAQFDHRMGAYLVFLGALALFIAARRQSGARKISAHLLFGLVLIQISLGIATLLNEVPIPLAALHQITAVALFSAALWHAYEMAGAGAALTKVQPAAALSA